MRNDDLLSEDDLARMLARAEAAKPGPWKSYVEGRDHVSGSSFIMTGPPDARGDDIELTGASDADQDFVAAAREDVPKLISEIRRLRRELGR